MSWNGAIIVAQVLLSPIMTRLYEPSQYGTFTIYSSMVANLALAGSLKYSDAIVLTESRAERRDLLALIFSFLTFLCIISFVFFFFFRDRLADLLNYTGPSSFFLLIPLGVLLTCCIEVFANTNIQHKLFGRNGKAIFLNNVFARLTSIGYAVSWAGRSAGLILGDFVGKLACLGFLGWRSKAAEKSPPWTKEVTLRGVKMVMRKFKSFPLYYFPSFLLSSFSGHLPLYFFQWQYGSAMVGAYAFASSLMEMFNRLIPYSLAPVLLQKANDLKKNSPELLKEKIYKLFQVMLGAATIIFSVFTMLAPPLFSVVFGSQWQTAGYFAVFIGIHAAYNFVAVSISEVYNVMGGQRLLLVNSIVGLALKVLAILLAYYYQMNEKEALLLYTVLNALGSILLIAGVFVILKHKVWKVTALLAVSLAILCGSLILSKTI